MKPEKIYKIVLNLLWINIICQIAFVFIVYSNLKDDYALSLSIVPLLIRFILLYYLKKKINIASSFLWLNIVFIITPCVIFYQDGFNLFDLTYYLQFIISIISLILVLNKKFESSLIYNEPAIVKKSNRIIYWVWIISFVFGNSFKKSFDKNHINDYSKSKHEQITEMLDSIDYFIKIENKNYPKMIDDVTSLDSMKFFRADSSISYYYTLTNSKVSELDLIKVKKIFTSLLSKKVKIDSNMMYMINQYHVNYEFVYHDKNKELITRIESKNLDLK